jgi:uncharacterized protein DUF4019
MCLIAILGTGIIHGQDPADKAAQTSVDAWLTLVDSHSYAASWDAAASIFKNALPQDQWSAALEKVRTPLGKVKSRVLASTTPTPSPPGAPPGDYLVFQFDTTYEQRSAAAEVVTAFKEKDGSWRVAGYFIK